MSSSRAYSPERRAIAAVRYGMGSAIAGPRQPPTSGCSVQEERLLAAGLW